MSKITWIIIVLIVVSIAVTVTEVGLRFGLLQKGKGEKPTGVNPLDGTIGTLRRSNWSREDFDDRQLRAICGAEVIGTTFAEL